MSAVTVLVEIVKIFFGLFVIKNNTVELLVYNLCVCLFAHAYCILCVQQNCMGWVDFHE